VRADASSCFLVMENQYDTKGKSVDVARADVPPLLAYFAFVALALVETDELAD